LQVLVIIQALCEPAKIQPMTIITTGADCELTGLHQISKLIAEEDVAAVDRRQIDPFLP
jgi:hypothetical protein